MELALAEAELAAEAGETPVGTVVVAPDGSIAGRGHNLVIAASDPTAHAEILAIRQACLAAKSERLPGYDLYVTLEPCAMCAAAISFARIRRLYFARRTRKAARWSMACGFSRPPPAITRRRSTVASPKRALPRCSRNSSASSARERGPPPLRRQAAFFRRGLVRKVRCSM